MYIVSIKNLIGYLLLFMDFLCGWIKSLYGFCLNELVFVINCFFIISVYFLNYILKF